MRRRQDLLKLKWSPSPENVVITLKLFAFFVPNQNYSIQIASYEALHLNLEEKDIKT